MCVIARHSLPRQFWAAIYYLVSKDCFSSHRSSFAMTTALIKRSQYSKKDLSAMCVIARHSLPRQFWPAIYYLGSKDCFSSHRSSFAMTTALIKRSQYSKKDLGAMCVIARHSLPRQFGEAIYYLGSKDCFSLHRSSFAKTTALIKRSQYSKRDLKLCSSFAASLLRLELQRRLIFLKFAALIH